MIDRARRRLMQAGLIGVVAPSLVAGLWQVARTPAEAEQQHTDRLSQAFYRLWNKKDLGDPEAYLGERGMLEASAEAIRAAVKADFVEGRTGDFDGYILSLTEAAIIASYGQHTATV